MTRSSRVVPLVLALAAFAGAAGANAAEVHGKITKLDPAARKLTISRHVYRYGPSFNAASLAQGQMVRIAYRWSHGHREAVRVLPGQPSKNAA